MLIELVPGTEFAILLRLNARVLPCSRPRVSYNARDYATMLLVLSSARCNAEPYGVAGFNRKHDIPLVPW